ncbi:MAG: DUF4397 domain-containing protein [Anaerolineales bacterium]|nr:DUF4397 domain-containing protein [Anaerolineales bacterium]
MIRKLMLIIAVMALGLVAITAPAPVSAQGAETSQVRFVHGIPSAGAVDIYLNSNLIVAGANFGDATPHLALPVGDYELALRAAGSDAASTPLLGGKLSLTALRQGIQQTVVFHGDISGLPTYTLIEDVVNPSQLGQARLHVIHAASGVGSVDLFGTNGAPITQGLTFDVPAGTVNIPVSSWDLVLINSGGDVENPLVSIGRVNFNTNTLYTFVVVGDAAAPRVLTLNTRLSADPAVSTVFTQIGHGSTDAPTVDIYANDVKIIAGLNPGEVTQHLPLPAGEVALTVREAGAPPNSTPAAEATLNLTSTTGAASVIAVGELSGGTFTFSVYESNIANIDPSKARIQVINTLALGSASASLSNGTILSDNIAVFGASTPLDVTPGQYSLNAKIADSEFVLPAQAYNGGTYYTALLYANVDAGLSLGATALKLEQNSLPGSVISANRNDALVNSNGGSSTDEVAANPIGTPPPQPTAVAQVTTVVAPAAPPVAPAPQSTLDTKVRAIVNLNAGANLQCREYPSAEAFSLGLIPNGSELEIRGYAGPADPEVDTPFIPVDPELFEDPKSVEDFEDLWLSAYWTAGDGGTVDCWVRADFLIMSFRNRTLRDPEAFFALEEMDIPIPVIREIPHNYPGEVVDSTIVTPPTPVKRESIATVNVNSGVNLHLRRYPDPTSESLALIPNGTDVIILGRTPITTSEIIPEEDDGENEGEATPTPEPILLETAWLFVEFTNLADGSVTTGWISSEYTILSKAGRTLELEEIEAISPATFGEQVSGPSVVSTTAPANPAASGPVTGVINIPAGANLNMYDAPSINAGLVRSLGAGSTVAVLGRTADNNWLNIRYEVIGEGTWVGWVSNTGGWVVIPVSVDSLPITG